MPLLVLQIMHRRIGRYSLRGSWKIGIPLQAGEVFGTVEAVKTVSDLFLPVAGSITELNAALAGVPESVNTDPYGTGWMVKMKVDNPADIDELMDAAAYESLVG